MKRRYDGYIDYEKKGEVVFIQKNGENKLKYKIQHDGCGCRQAEVKGKARTLFFSSENWFNPNFWYDRNNWLDEFGYLNFYRIEPSWEFKHKENSKDIFGFDNKLSGKLAIEYQKMEKKISNIGADQLSPSASFAEIMSHYQSKKYKDVWNSEHNKFIEKFKHKLVHKDDVLKDIFAIIEKKTHKKIELIGNEWFEAYIPVKLGGEKGVITWQNCD